MAKAAEKQLEAEDKVIEDSKVLARKRATKEVVFGIVGHVGSGTSTVAETLKDLLEKAERDGDRYQCEIIKARRVIEAWADLRGKKYPTEYPFTIEDVEIFQDLGDEFRLESDDHAAVARAAISEIRNARAKLQETKAEKGVPVVPDGKPRAYIIDSIRHPAEVKLLRHLYGEAFVLIGVVCEEKTRRERISEKYRDAGLDAAERFMQRDAKASEKHGQRVSDAFHLSDFFLNNTASRLKNKKPNPNWEIGEDLLRLIQLVSHEEIERPRIEETAMYEAAGAAMRSACLSRQVGAALLDASGNVVSTGANEVPTAGGGVYGESFDTDAPDDRCFKNRGFCSNTVEQNNIASEISDNLSEHFADGTDKAEISNLLKAGRVGELLEFSRAVHAEMDAILAAGRKGTSTVGCRLYVTTFPCHYCARHIVSAGIDEVQFIEPYPKSKAFDLHDDSIQNDIADDEWQAPSAGGQRVLFRPYTGVAPRMYRRAFQKNRELKDKATGKVSILPPEWGSPYDVSKTSYAEFEVSLTDGFT